METDKRVMKTAKKDCGGRSNCTVDHKTEAENLHAQLKGAIKKEGLIYERRKN